MDEAKRLAVVTGELMSFVQAAREIDHDAERDRERHRTDLPRDLGLHEVAQRGAVDVFEDEVVVALVRARIEHGDEVRVAQLATEPRFATQRSGDGRIATQVLERALHDDMPYEAVRAVDAREIDACGAAGTDRADQAIGTDGFGDAGLRCAHACPSTGVACAARARTTRTRSPIAPREVAQRRACASSSRSATSALAVW